MSSSSSRASAAEAFEALPLQLRENATLAELFRSFAASPSAPAVAYAPPGGGESLLVAWRMLANATAPGSDRARRAAALLQLIGAPPDARLADGPASLVRRGSDAPAPALAPARQTSGGSPPLPSIVAPLAVSQESLRLDAAAAGGGWAWEVECTQCLEPMRAGERVLLCTAGHQCCATCAVNCVRESAAHRGRADDCSMRLGDAAERCKYLPDALAAVYAISQARAPAAGGGAAPLELRELQTVRDDALAALSAAAEGGAAATPAAWVAHPCPCCAAALLLPAAVLRSSGFPVFCHSCTHRVCARCNVAWRAGGHAGRSCEAMAARRADAVRDNEVGAPANLPRCPNPKCGILIDFPEACNHMACGKCGTQFCFLCRGIYKMRSHDGHLVPVSCAHARNCPQLNPSLCTCFHVDGSLQGARGGRTPRAYEVDWPWSSIGFVARVSAAFALARFALGRPQSGGRLALASILPTLGLGPLLPALAFRYMESRAGGATLAPSFGRAVATAFVLLAVSSAAGAAVCEGAAELCGANKKIFHRPHDARAMRSHREALAVADCSYFVHHDAPPIPAPART